MFKKNLIQHLKTSKKHFSSQYHRKILVTGCGGQVGSALVPRLYQKYGVENILCTDVSNKPAFVQGEFIKLDVSNEKEFKGIAFDYKPSIMLHLAAILSGMNN
jgi:nucleoside-diphosphate-sugar epimerase